MTDLDVCKEIQIIIDLIEKWKHMANDKLILL